MSRGSCPWEAPSVVFYVSRRLLDFHLLTGLMYRVGLLEESCSRVLGGLENVEAGSDECLEDRVLGRFNLSYSMSLRGFGRPRY